MSEIIKYIVLPTIKDDCSLSIAEFKDLPFPITRIYYIYDLKRNIPRGFHAHKKTSQVIFCLRGKVRLVLESSEGRAECVLDTASEGVLLDIMVWHEMHDMTEDTLLLVLASRAYEESDYIRSYTEFKKLL
jgi:hypothetical protein